MKTILNHLNESLNGASFLRLLRVAFLLLLAMSFVYGYYLHTEGQLLVVLKELFTAHIMPFIKAYGLVMIAVIAIFLFGFWCGRRGRSTPVYKPEPKTPQRKKTRKAR